MQHFHVKIYEPLENVHSVSSAYVRMVNMESYHSLFNAMIIFNSKHLLKFFYLVDYPIIIDIQRFFIDHFTNFAGFPDYY